MESHNPEKDESMQEMQGPAVLFVVSTLGIFGASMVILAILVYTFG